MPTSVRYSPVLEQDVPDVQRTLIVRHSGEAPSVHPFVSDKVIIPTKKGLKIVVRGRNKPEEIKPMVTATALIGSREQTQ